MFVGNSDGETSMAILASFAAVCKDNDVDFEPWLADVLYRLDTTPAARAVELLPHEWKKLRDAEANDGKARPEWQPKYPRLSTPAAGAERTVNQPLSSPTVRGVISSLKSIGKTE